MNVTWVILSMGAGMYALRLSGLALPALTLPPACERALRFLPVAVLTALVVSSLTAPADHGAARMIAAAGAALIARTSGRMWACIVGGLALYWLLRLAWGTVAAT